METRCSCNLMMKLWMGTTYPRTQDIADTDPANYGVFESVVRNENIQINCDSREPVQGSSSGKNTLTMHVVRFKMPTELIPKAIGDVSERNPAKLAGYHTFKLEKTVVSFAPGIDQAVYRFGW